jgi:uncharacterized membrane protein
MQAEIGLVQSKTFWSALLALIAIVAQAFGWQSIVVFASDPATANTILSAVAVAGTLFAMIFRGVANAKVTSILPPKSA